jgi:hypothetical protein
MSPPAINPDDWVRIKWPLKAAKSRRNFAYGIAGSAPDTAAIIFG